MHSCRCQIIDLLSANQDDFDGYISVSSSDDGSNMMEVPVAEDNTLSIATLAHSFPDAIGLKFKNQTTGVYRTLASVVCYCAH